MRLPMLVLAALAAAAPLPAQSNAERIATDGYSRSHDYDLVHQRIELRGFDWERLGFTGSVTITLRALRPAFDSVVLDAGALLQIGKVRAGARGAPLRHQHRGDTLVVHLTRPAGFGDTVRFTVDYQGRVKNGRGLTFIEADTLPPRRPRQIWSQGEADDNHRWFPTYDFPNDKTTWDLIATVPAGFTAVSNGRLVLDRNNPDRTRTMHWRQNRPAATYLASLIVAPLVKLTDRWRNLPLEYYVYREDSARARRLFGVTPDMIAVFSRLTGVDYPWHRYAQTTVADFFGGMENVSATTLVDWIPDGRAYADRPWFQHILIPHELAHQWFGDYVTTANWANMWLNEGFAEFMPGQYWAEKHGRHAEDDYFLDEYQQYLGIDHRRRMPLAALASNNIYPKGALVLRMLKQHLGPERFWAGVRHYLKDHAEGVAVSDDLRQAFLAATGENLEWFWQQWVYGAGHPDFEVSAAWDSAAAAVRVRVRQTQRDSLTADSTGLRYLTAEVFTMPVTVRVGTTAGDRTVRAELTEREQEIVVPEVHTPPTMVVFDEGNRILKTLRFEQPTAWLAAQLRQDPDLWNRWWVIGRLAERKDDADAARALAAAATEADYFLTRAQAAEALGAFAGEGPRDALLRALEDSSAQVRAAAVGALGQHDGAPARNAVRKAWETDTSYAVRAAALGSLARLNPERARELALQGLGTPSYQDAIADAALSVIAQLGDTSLVGPLGAAVETTGNAAYLLGVFAARGSQDALERLTRFILSPRAQVRRRALLAFRYVVPPALGRPRLTALLDEAPDDGARDEIQATLDQLRP